MRTRRVVLIAVLLAACEHAAPFQPGDYGPSGPFSTTAPTRLTLNPGRDVAPAWLPGDAAIVYTAQRLDRRDGDHCLALLPPGGGAISRYACRTPGANDSIDAFWEAAVAADGQLAYVRAGSILPAIPFPPDAQALVVATLADPNDARVLRTIPYTSPAGLVQGMSHIHWLSPTRLVFLSEDVTYPRASQSQDTVHTGLQIGVVDFGGPAPVLTVVSGTNGATSVTVGSTADTLYFTLAGDGRVLRYAFSSDVTDVAHDFGAGRVAREAAVAGGRLFAVLDGRANLGGDLHVVNLATGADSVVPAPTSEPLVLYGRIAPSADGRRVVAQGRTVVIDTVPLGPGSVLIDTIPTSSVDLWLHRLP
jgi:hypothetical protein